MKKQSKIKTLLLSLICAVTAACGGDGLSVMTKQIEGAEEVLNSIDSNSVSSLAHKVELIAERTLLLAKAALLRNEVKDLNNIDHAHFNEEQRKVQDKVNELAVESSRLKARVIRIQVIDAAQTKLDDLAAHIEDLKEKSHGLTGDLKVKIEAGVAELEKQKIQMGARIAEMSAHIKDNTQGFWESLTTASDKAWATIKTRAQELRDMIKGIL